MRQMLIEQIHIAENRIRKVFDEQGIKELADSIESKGLMNPITLRKQGSDVFLLAGENRLRAIKLLHEQKRRFFCDGSPIQMNHAPFLWVQELDEILALEAELEENTKRKDLTWLEQAEARKKLFDLRRVQAEARGEKYGVTDLAEELAKAGASGSSGRQVAREMAVAQFLDKPGVREAKTLKDAIAVAKKATTEFLAEALGEMLDTNAVETSHTLINGDSTEELAKLSAEQFHCICTDPPYGIGIDDSGDMVTHQHHYADGPEVLEKILATCPQEMFRVLTPEAHLYWFCDFRWFERIRARLTEVGFSVYQKPIIWWKRGKAMAPDITRWPKEEYECIVYAIKGDKRSLRLDSNVISTTYSGTLAQAEKPKDLFCNLLSRSVLPGQRVLDPFCGSGVIFTAADELRCTATGIELDKARHDLANIRAFGL